MENYHLARRDARKLLEGLGHPEMALPRTGRIVILAFPGTGSYTISRTSQGWQFVWAAL